MESFKRQIHIPAETQMLNFGKKLSKKLGHRAILYFQGDLGAGKTTLIRGILQGLGYKGRVKSPTYTLVENYEIDGTQIFHFDFYRLQDTSELEHLGLRDYFAQPAILLIEWPERAGNLLPNPDIHCTITVQEKGRILDWVAFSHRGEEILKNVGWVDS